ncbi:MAG TPA: DUF2147 domain-containing protein [Candidatus Hydrogenedentes bacterium]|nr:DUF2147 domain-containing protein [Candidatus Hydrogenedentota bacterium]HPG69204.1 DUF2147 domain-containing protein [Candidatus Hydrogenedentota bacterium]
MRISASVLFIAMVVATGAAFAADEADAILGKWITEDGKSYVEISKVNGKYNGKIVWLKDEVYEEGDEEAGKPVHDRENPDQALRNRPILGLQMLDGFEYAGKNTWKKGTIYDPENGKTYKCKMTLQDPKTLDVRGFIGVSMIGRTTVWVRYEPPKDEGK